MAGALEGIRVLEFSEIIAGPFCGMLLGDMGANVIKIEPPEGEPWRLIAQFVPKESRWYVSLNRNKRSVVLDLKSPAGLEALLRLVKSADVLAYNVRPQAMQRLGLDYESLAKINPRLVYVGMFGFSQRGRYAPERYARSCRPRFQGPDRAGLPRPRGSVRRCGRTAYGNALCRPGTGDRPNREA